MKVLIIGGGVCGPALALALKRSGHDVEIFDRTMPPVLEPGKPWIPADIGGALLLNENILRVFKYLGLLDEIKAAGTQVAHHNFSRFDGRVVASFLTFDKPDLPTTGVLRSAVARIVNKELNTLGVFMKAGRKLVSIEQPTDGRLGVIAHFEDGTTAEGDILVGADGVNSATRALLFPDVMLKKSNYTGFFGVSPLNGKQSPVHTTAMVDVTTGNYAGIMPSGNTMIHWAMFESRPDANENISWDLAGDLAVERDRMLSIVQKWKVHQSFLDLIQDATRVTRVNFTMLDPMPEWHKYNCVLIGDAVHAMYPFVGQGAGMSLEDTVSLSMLLDAMPTQPQKAFALLQELRAPRVDKVVATSESMGKNLIGTSPAMAAVGQVVIKLFSFVSRAFGIGYFSNEIIRFDSAEATRKFIASKGLYSS
ncbi:hypothetical protein HK405_001314 [Cladochytrium tenue]|nr:hypothetical protein HK405_001314 [Cladochytrium tenue]